MRLVSLIAVLLLALGGTTASAGHDTNPNAGTTTFSCDGSEITVVAGPGAAAHVVGSNETIVGMRFTNQVVVDDEVVFEGTFTQGKGLQTQDRLTTCMVEYPIPDEAIPFVEEDFGIEIEGDTVVVRDIIAFLMPRSR